jgi:Protein of unknown function (DUF2442)
MKRIISVSALAGYRLAIEFEDGVKGTVELESQLFGPMFAPLRDETVFSQVGLDEFGAPCWSNGADLAPDAIYAQLTGQPITGGPATKFTISEEPKQL